MEDKDIQIEEVSIENNTPTDSDTATEEITERDAELESLTTQVQDLNDKYLRLAAELENTRRRASLDCESAARNRAMGVAKNFLPVMDAIEAALKHTPDDAGVIAMQRAMNAAFTQIGIVKIHATGQPLNPQFHNAIQVVSNPDVTPNTVVEELQTGYMFGDTVMRPSMVIVAK